MATADLLNTILYGSKPYLDAARLQVAASRGKGDRGLVAAAERVVATAPGEAITFDAAGTATLRVADKEFCGGRSAPRSILSLKESVNRRAAGAPTAVRFSVLTGSDLVTDIGSLQAMAPESTLFQAASQFNCLESLGPFITDVASYLADPTQGPRASISAFPGALVRHYAAPDGAGGRFVQSPGRQIDLLAEALPPALGRVQSGYLTASCLTDASAVAQALHENFDRIQVGVHDGVQVVLAHHWDGEVQGEPLIAQVCSTLLRAAYLGTLLAAVELGKRRAMLTLIGGGVFGNPHALICDSILWAIAEVERLPCGPVEVVLNGRDLAAETGDALRQACERSGGVFRALGRATAG